MLAFTCHGSVITMHASEADPVFTDPDATVAWTHDPKFTVSFLHSPAFATDKPPAARRNSICYDKAFLRLSSY